MGFLKSKFFIILLSVTLAVVIISSVMSLTGLMPIVKNALGSVMTPFERLGSAVARAVSGFGSYFSDFGKLEDRNDALMDENAALREKLREAEKYKGENEWLRGYLDLKGENPSLSLLDASVIGYESGNFRTVFTVNRGSAHGVSAGMAVICREGVVGYVSEVGLTWSKIETIIETATSVGAYIQRSGEIGVIEGDYSLKYDGVCKMTYLAEDADIVIGDSVITSGLGSIYPAELFVGEVTAIDKDEYSRRLIATVKPAVDFSEIDRVMIITSTEASVGE